MPYRSYTVRRIAGDGDLLQPGEYRVSWRSTDAAGREVAHGVTVSWDGRRFRCGGCRSIIRGHVAACPHTEAVRKYVAELL